MFISYHTITIVVFAVLYGAYYFYRTVYKKLDEARNLFKEKEDLKRLLPYFSKAGSCSSESAVQGKKQNNFYDIKDKGSYYECTLFDSRSTLNIKKNAPFAEVKKVIEKSISDIEHDIEQTIKSQL